MEGDHTREIIGLAMRVHSRLGPGLLESAYERCLCHELQRHDMAYVRQIELPIEYDDLPARVRLPCRHCGARLSHR